MAERIVIKNVRLSYPHLFKAEAFEGQDPKFGCVLIIPKDHPQIQALREACVRVGAEKWPGKIQPGKWPSSLFWPIKDGDLVADEHPEYEGCHTISVSSKTPLVLLDRRKQRLTEEDDKLYPGAYVNASLTVADFDAGVKKGVSIFVNGIQFFADGERLAGHDATEDFEELDEDDFDVLGGGDDDLPF